MTERTPMKQTGILLILLCVALPILPQSPPRERVMRQHRRVTLANKDVFEWSELVYSGEVDGVVSLWRAPSGEMLIFRQSDVYKKGTMNFSVSDPSRHIFVQAVVHLPYGGTSAVEAKRALQDVPPSAYASAPLSLAIRGYHSSARLEAWHLAYGASP